MSYELQVRETPNGWQWKVLDESGNLIVESIGHFYPDRESAEMVCESALKEFRDGAWGEWHTFKVVDGSE